MCDLPGHVPSPHHPLPIYLMQLTCQSNGLCLSLPWASSLNSCLLLLGRLGWVGLCWTLDLRISFFKSYLLRPRSDLGLKSQLLPYQLIWRSPTEVSKQKASLTSCPSLGVIGVSCDPSRRILLSAQSRKEQVSLATEEITCLIFLPSLMIFIHLSCNCFILGTVKALSSRCHAFECLGGRKNKETAVKGRSVVCKAAL